MILKTYKAHDLTAALAQARAELGADALVLAQSDVRGPLGLTGVEVTVAASRVASSAPEDGGDETLSRLVREVRALRSKVDELNAPAEADSSRAVPQARGAADAAAAGLVFSPLLRASCAALVEAGLTPDLAERYARIAARDLDGQTDARRMAAAAAKAIGDLVPFTSMPLCRCLFVVGPPGSGKTTTVAKLVARLAADPERSVFFAEADADRIGSVEQAEIFSRHLGVVLARVDGPEDLERALLDAGNSGAIVVDTPGIGAKDTARLRRLVELRQMVPDAGVVVLLPAGLHREEAARVLDRFAPLRPTCAALTRTDDGARVGELVSALAERGLGLAFVTTGHGVPDDLEGASARGLAAMLLRNASQRLGSARKAEARP